MKGLSKSKIIAHQQCPKRLWLQVYKPELLEFSEDSKRALRMGTHAGEIARTMFPDGILVDEKDVKSALQRTKERLQSDHPSPIFEAALSYDGVLVFVDILVPEEEGWHLIEVKSSTSVKDYHRPDATVQTWVARQAGLIITRTSIACIDRGFIYPGGGDYDGLFYLTDISEEANTLCDDVVNWVVNARLTLNGEEPEISVGDQCSSPFKCPFIDYCNPPREDAPEYPLTDLPSARKLIEQLAEQGFDDLTQVPPEVLASPKHRRIHQSVISGRPYISEGVQEVMSDIRYPRYYLDFETIQFAVPIWPGTRPYQQIPFQWSCHVEDETGGLSHYEFLADGQGDPRPGFAQSLADLLSAMVESNGIIVAYNAGFERSRINESARDFPQYEPCLSAASQAMVDLLPIAREHFYHPSMHGSWSIKYVLPAVAPELSYQGMSVADGMMAQDTFLEIVQNQLPHEEQMSKREALLEYCQQDTLAMVKIAHYFEGRSDEWGASQV